MFACKPSSTYMYELGHLQIFAAYSRSMYTENDENNQICGRFNGYTSFYVYKIPLRKYIYKMLKANLNGPLASSLYANLTIKQNLFCVLPYIQGKCFWRFKNRILIYKFELIFMFL